MDEEEIITVDSCLLEEVHSSETEIRKKLYDMRQALVTRIGCLRRDIRVSRSEDELTFVQNQNEYDLHWDYEHTLNYIDHAICRLLDMRTIAAEIFFGGRKHFDMSVPDLGELQKSVSMAMIRTKMKELLEYAVQEREKKDASGCPSGSTNQDAGSKL